MMSRWTSSASVFLHELTQMRTLGLYDVLMQVRPAQVADVLKKCLLIRRGVITCITGGLFWADPVSVLGQHLLSEGAHEPAMTRLVLELLRPSDIFVDVGGHEGYFSIVASRRL